MAAPDRVEQRFRLLFERHWRRVRAYALRRCGDVTAADDVVADVFLVAWRRIGEIPEDNELAWLLGVARNVLSNTQRGDARRARLLARIHSVTPDIVIDEIEVATDSDGAVEKVREALRRLDPKDAEILQLSVWEQLSHSQIAVVLGCSVNAVGIRIYRARQRLAEMLQKDYRHPGQTEPDVMS